MKQSNLNKFFVLGLALWAIYLVSPSLIYFGMDKEERNTSKFEENLPSWLPQKHIKLGLDLQGGVQLVLGVNTDSAVDNKLSRLATDLKRWSDMDKKFVKKSYNLDKKQTLRVELVSENELDNFITEFNKEYSGFKLSNRDGVILDFKYDDKQIATIKESSIEQAERVVRTRIDKWGVTEPLINRRKIDNSILVQLPGFSDPGKAKELLGRTALLSFHIVDDKFTGFSSVIESTLPESITKTSHGQDALESEDKQALLEYVKTIKIPDDRRVFLQRTELADGKKYRFTTYVVEASSELNGDDILDAGAVTSNAGLTRRPAVSLRFTGIGSKRFADVTGANVNRRLAIVLENEIVSAPNIQTKISGGRAEITLGVQNFDAGMKEATDLALILKSGALPAKIEVLEERQVGASLGPELADKGVKGIATGLVFVLIFMLIWYRKTGVIACFALIFNALLLLSLMASLGFALTLPGIAGFILTLGMAVDANVLINERIRQEIKEGKSALAGVEAGFANVYWTIIDANVTTLIAAFVLMQTSTSGSIKGFAVTLMIGLVVSMYTSLYVSKLFFSLALQNKKDDQSIRDFLLGKNFKQKIMKYDFLKFSKPIGAIGVAIVLAVFIGGFTKGLNWGVDFAGGTEMQIDFKNNITSKEISDVAKESGIKDITVQSVEGPNHSYLVKFGQITETNIGSKAESISLQNFKDNLLNKLSSFGPVIERVDYVGPQIGKELRTQGVLSVIYAIFGVLVYIAFRFDMRFAPGAVIKMVLDIIIIFGFYIYFQRTFDLTSVAAFLTIVGYSVNDTIVIYDRIRENINLNPRKLLPENINLSLNETLSRTINTSVTTIVALTGILILSSGQIWTFAMAMLIGVFAATITSQFIASPLIIWLEKRMQASKQKA